MNNKVRYSESGANIDLISQGKIPPNAKSLEDGVVGALLLSFPSCRDVLSILKPEDFYSEDNKMMYEAITTIDKRGGQVDILTVCEELRKVGKLEAVGGPFAVSKKTTPIASTAHVEEHSRIIKEKSMSRSLIMMANEVIRVAYDEAGDPFNLIELASNKILEISNVGSSKHAESFSQVMASLLNNISAKQKDGKKPSFYLSEPDKLCDFRQGDLIIIAGRPGMGKTALAEHIARSWGMDKRPVGIFSLEMTSQNMAARMISPAARLSAMQIMSGRLTDEDFHRIHIGCTLLADGFKDYIFIDDNPTVDITTVRNKAKRMKSVHNIELLIVDYLQLMSSERKKNDNREQEISTISRGLKLLAKELQIPVIALSQLSRACEQRGGDMRPKLSDLRESGCLTGDTKVYDLHSKKIVRIEDLIYRKKINTFAFNTNKIVGMKATKAWSTGVKPVFKITLINGLSINATANHKFLTPDGWFSCDTLNAKSIAIPVSYEFPKPIDPEDSEVRLLGHFISNGSCVKGQPIRYTCNTDDYDLAEIVASDAKISTGNKVDPKIKRQEVANRSKWLNVFFKPTFHITHGKTSPIADIMRRYGLFNVRSKDKFIPDEVFFWSNKSACLFLSALFTGDGNIFFSDKNGRKSLKISYSTASEKLSVDIQNLLAKCGIVSFKTKLQNKKGQSWYVIYIAGKSNIKMFVEKIGFISSRKNKKLIEAWELVKDRLAGWNKYEFNEDRTLCFMPVKSIELIGDVEVYDMEVPIAHNFIANGIIAHNSIEQDADMVCFTYRPEYYYRQNVGGFSQVITIDGGSVVSGQIPIEGYAEIIVAKQRNGNTGTSQVGFIPKYTQFVNYESI